MKLLILLTLAAAASAACPNACSGHGTCGLSSKCKCQARWVGNDCSQRQCPSGLSWIVSPSNANVPAGGALGGYHPYAECSNRGICDRDSGECVCFDGYEGRGCRRTSCPNACSGHGFCRYNYEINSDYSGYDTESLNRRYDKEQWDAGKTRQCVCDRGYEGIDCASRICPKGDDPLTACTEHDPTDPGQSVDDVHKITLSKNGDYSATAFFTLTFTDMFNGEYTTRPIATDIQTKATANCRNVAFACTADNGSTDCSAGTDSTACDAIAGCTSVAAHCDKQSADIRVGPELCAQHSSVGGATCTGQTYSKRTSVLSYTAMAADIEEALEALPNFAVPNVTVTVATVSDDHVVSVTFVDAANAGSQNLLQVNAGSGHDHANMQPRFNGVTDASPSVAHETVTGSDKLKEHVACSNRGSCDSGSGLCQCYEGFTGEACGLQTVYF